METKNKYMPAYHKYLEDFLASDPAKMAELAGGSWDGTKITLNFLQTPTTIQAETGEIFPEPRGLVEKILILKYLCEAQGMEAAGLDDEYIAFRQLPAGANHQAAFRLEVLEPLGNTFGGNLPLFAQVAHKFGGLKSKGGDLAYTFFYFPKISLRIIIWQADDEFPAQSGFLFAKRCQFHLDTDGLNEVANSLVAMLLEEV